VLRRPATTLRKQVTRAITAADSGQFVPIVAFDCRGCEPTAWHPEEARSARGWLRGASKNLTRCTRLQGFNVRTPGAKFENVDMSEVRALRLQRYRRE
jgi:hypothetical protein